MRWFWSKSPFSKALKAGLSLLEGAIGFGLVSGAAVAAAVGNLLLCGILAAIAFGVFARISRRAKVDAAARKSDARSSE